jgi:hypothetical protein
LLDIFLQNLNQEQVEKLTEVFIKKLNNLYSNKKLRQHNPQTSWEWMQLFRSTQYLSGNSDPLNALLILTYNSPSKKFTKLK